MTQSRSICHLISLCLSFHLAAAVSLTSCIFDSCCSDDIKAVQALHTAFGPVFLRNTVLLWSHAHLLGPGGIAQHLEGVDDTVLQFVDQMQASTVIENKACDYGSTAHANAVQDLISLALVHAGPLPKPTGKRARRLRQAEQRQAELQKLAAEGRSTAATGDPWCSIL